MNCVKNIGQKDDFGQDSEESFLLLASGVDKDYAYIGKLSL